MVNDIHIVEEPKKTLSMHPKKFALWLFMVSIVMLFAAWTSAYIVKKASGDWQLIEIPQVLWVSSLVIMLSSVSMHWSKISAKKDSIPQLKMGLIITLLLGLVFLALQWQAWGQLVDQQAHFVGKPSSSFIYILTGMHGLHLISGLIFVGIILAAAWQYKIHSRSMVRIEMCTTYWHFLGGLWLYLFIFLLLNH